MALSARTSSAGLDWVDALLDGPRGARFFRCALQVNPHAYLVTQKKGTEFDSESAYNTAIIEACQANGVDAIAVTDHYRVKEAASLISAAEAAGIAAFPGFEAVSKDGVHLLCIFDRGTSLDAIDRRIGECGVQEAEESRPGMLDTEELLLACATSWDAVCIAAHVVGAGGLLQATSGQTRINLWRSQYLTAVAIPGPVSDVQDEYRPILRNQNGHYKREPPPAIINASDVNGPADLGLERSRTEIKMTEISLSGLKQAFGDPESRIRITGDPEPQERTEIVGVRWQGGFLDGLTLPLNDNLNVLVGGRGTGKSTVIESLRYALELEPFGDAATLAHEGLVKHVLRSGTRISVVIRSHHPSTAVYVVERAVPNPPIVRSADTGELLDLAPRDVAPRIELYGQHEISEIARSERGRTQMLARTIVRDPRLNERKHALRRDLKASRARITAIETELAASEERLATLPTLQETLRRYRDSGVEKRLAERSEIVEEEQLLETAEARVSEYESWLEELRADLPVDRAFLATGRLKELGGAKALAPLDAVLSKFNDDLEAAAKRVESAIQRAEARLSEVRALWEERAQAVDEAYEKILRELQRDDIDGAEFIGLQKEIQRLKTLATKHKRDEKGLDELVKRRREFLTEWEDTKAEEARELDRAAKRVTKRLRRSVQVTVQANADRSALVALLRDRIGGRLDSACRALEEQSDLSLPALATAIRAGAKELTASYGIPQAQAQRLADAEEHVIMELEELELAPITQIDLNVGSAEDPTWQALDEVSAGQQATAILLLLLLESDAPLIVDQPEDDLDNRFVADGVVPRMREAKRRRQFIFSSHNANIPVLGDAELIAGFSADADHGDVEPDHLGSIDVDSVRELVEAVLEGGHEAFERRRRKYGF